MRQRNAAAKAGGALAFTRGQRLRKDFGITDFPKRSGHFSQLMENFSLRVAAKGKVDSLRSEKRHDENIRVRTVFSV
jgi:hypothetical protein